jgi:hypothetical protein
MSDEHLVTCSYLPICQSFADSAFFVPTASPYPIDGIFAGFSQMQVCWKPAVHSTALPNVGQDRPPPLPVLVKPVFLKLGKTSDIQIQGPFRIFGNGGYQWTGLIIIQSFLLGRDSFRFCWKQTSRFAGLAGSAPPSNFNSCACSIKPFPAKITSNPL